ncbi:MAG: spermidine synthase [Alphaproteobacteria bacterium]|nr:MAG: spermidine synthase [Alphaproteobacteria bacterium]
MLPRTLIDSATIPGGGEIRLIRRGSEFSIMLGGTELMNSRVKGSEEALARFGCAGVPARARVLIGGLGMGFTLRAALEALGPEARVTVAELVPAVVRWARGPMAELLGGALDDRRVEIFDEDVADSIARGGWDSILLDVDNGPGGLTRPENDRLYGRAGLAAARDALTRGGMLAIWSSHPDPAFASRLKRAGFSFEEQVVRSGPSGKGPRHVIWLARRR